MGKGRIDLASLSDDQLISLGAKLEGSLWTNERELTEAERNIDLDAAPSTKSRVKLGLSVGTALTGIILVPFTGGVSAVLAAASLGLAAWDFTEHSSAELKAVTARQRVKKLEKDINRINSELRQIWRELCRRSTGGRPAP